MKKLLQIILLLIILIGLYSWAVCPRLLEVKEYNIINENIPKSFYGTKIVHISDIHYGRTIKGEELLRIVEEINKIKPDIVLLTGDLLDMDRPLTNEDTNTLIDELSKIETKLGKYAIYGNHEYYHDSYEKIVTKSGFKLLVNEYEIIYNESNEPIFLGGLDSAVKSDANIEAVMSYYQDEKQTVLPKYKIIAVHEPDYFDEINKYDVDLVLSGHSHNGQIRIPIIGKIYTPIGSQKYYEPYYKIDDTELYISSGLGTALLNIRFMVKPSFNLYRLRNK